MLLRIVYLNIDKYKHSWHIKVYELVIKEYRAADSKQSGHVSGNKYLIAASRRYCLMAGGSGHVQINWLG